MPPSSLSDPNDLPPAVPEATPRPDPNVADGTDAIVELLEPAEELVAEAIALGDGLLDVASIVQVTDSTAVAIAGAIDVLAHVGLVRHTPDGRIIAAHAHVRGALIERMSRMDRAELHERIALVLAGRGVDGAVIVAHIDASGSVALAAWGAELAQTAGMAALEAGDPARAQLAFERADRLTERSRYNG